MNPKMVARRLTSHCRPETADFAGLPFANLTLGARRKPCIWNAAADITGQKCYSITPELW